MENESIDLEKIDKVLKERALRFGKVLDDEDEDLIEMIVFNQFDTSYAVPLEMLSETRTISRVTFLPLVSDAILGVINVRGRIVSIYKLSNQEDKKITSGFALVGQGDASHVAIWAESITGTASVMASEIRNKPISLADKEYIKGVGSDGMIYLDLDKLITSKNLYTA